jgi:hypothetical protein
MPRTHEYVYEDLSDFATTRKCAIHASSQAIVFRYNRSLNHEPDLSSRLPLCYACVPHNEEVDFIENVEMESVA